MGSESDLKVMEEAAGVLRGMGVPYEMGIYSAHRLPDETSDYAKTAEERGIKVIIAGAGMAAHLAGVIAAQTTLPVIGVPIKSGALAGVDALYATVQMPSGIPVATVAIDGAKNAAHLACQILAVGDPDIKRAVKAAREKAKDDLKAKIEIKKREGILT